VSPSIRTRSEMCPVPAGSCSRLSRVQLRCSSLPVSRW
jgi:hypothetical protein